MNKLEEILNTATNVVKKNKHVKIKEEEITKLINNWNCEESTHWLSKNPLGLLDNSVEDIVNFLLILGSIVYSFLGSPKWTITTEENEKIDGSFALIYVLLKLQKEKGHLDFTKITYAEFKQALDGNTEIPLIKERYFTVYEISKIVNEKMKGNFYKYTINKTNDIELFNLIVDNFPSFKDIRTYEGKTIYFYKLAQLVVSDILHIRKLKENIDVDYSHLVGCADYKIPQVLRELNILVYSEELAKIIDSKTEIEENSIYEVEIRASMIVVIDKIKKALKNKMWAMDINDMIWSLSQNEVKNAKPYHHTRTTSY